MKTPQKESKFSLYLSYSILVVIFIVDCMVPFGIFGGVPYVIGLVLLMSLLKPKDVLWFSATCGGLAVLAFLFGEDHADMSGLMTRFMAVFTMVAIAMLIKRHTEDGVSHHEQLRHLNSVVEKRTEGLKQVVDQLDEIKIRLAESEELGHFGFWEYHPATQEMVWSNGVFAIYGFPISPQAPSMEEFLDQCHTEDMQTLQRSIQYGLVEKKQYTVEYRLIMPDGGVKWIFNRGRPIVNKQGSVEMLVGTIQDVTTLKHSQESLQSNKARYTTLFKNAGVGKVLMIPNKRILETNRAFAQWVGYNEKTLLKIPIEKLIHEDDRSMDNAYARDMISGDIEFYQKEKRFVRRDGTILWGMFSVSPVHDVEDKVTCFAVEVVDITAHKNMEMSMKKAQESWQEAEEAFTESEASRRIAESALKESEKARQIAESDLAMLKQKMGSGAIEYANDQDVQREQPAEEISSFANVALNEVSEQTFESRVELTPGGPVGADFEEPPLPIESEIGVELFVDTLKDSRSVSTRESLGDSMPSQPVPEPTLEPIVNEEPVAKSADSGVVYNLAFDESNYDFTKDLVTIIGFDGCYKRVSTALTKELGFGEDELDDQHFLNFIHQEDRELVHDEFYAMQSGTNVQKLSLRHMSKFDGYRRFIWTTSVKKEQEIIYSVFKPDLDFGFSSSPAKKVSRSVEPATPAEPVPVEQHAAELSTPEVNRLDSIAKETPERVVSIPPPVVPEPVVSQPAVPKPAVPEPAVPEPAVSRTEAPGPETAEPVRPEIVAPERVVSVPPVPEYTAPAPINTAPINTEPIIPAAIVPEPIAVEPAIPEPTIEPAVPPVSEIQDQAGPELRSVREPRSELREEAAVKSLRIPEPVTPEPVAPEPPAVLVADEAVVEAPQRKPRSTKQVDWRRLTDRMPFQVWMLSTDRSCQYVNKKVRDFTGLPFEQLEGRGWSKTVHPEDYRKYREYYAEVFVNQDPMGCMYRLRRNDGVYRWMQESSVPIYNKAGTFEGYLVTCMEVSTLKAIDNKFANAFDDAVNLVDLKSALHPCQRDESQHGMTDGIKIADALINNSNEVPNIDLARLMEFAGRRLLKLVNNILSFANTDKDAHDLLKRSVSLEEILSSTLEMLAPLRRDEGPRFQVNYGENDVRLMVDKVLAHRVFENLLRNLIEWAESRVITVDMFEEGPVGIVEIRHIGQVIEPDFLTNLEKLFRPSSSTALQRKAGLEMSLIKRLVEAMGGTLLIQHDEDASPMIKVRFSLAEPQKAEEPVPVVVDKALRGESPVEPAQAKQLADVVEAIASLEAPPPRPAIITPPPVQEEEEEILIHENGANGKAISRHRVLIGETNSETQRLVRSLLQPYYDLTIVPNTDDLLKQAEASQFDLLLLDVHLQGGHSGVDVLRELRRRPQYTRTPAIAVAASASAMDQRELIDRAGFDGFLRKPYSIVELLETVERMIET